MSGVQRFLSGHKNHIRNATFDGPVKPITNAVIQRAIPRQGSSSGSITGTFTGKEQAEYEIEMLDTLTDTPPVTQPVFNGSGNGSMTGVVAVGLTSRTFTVELTDLGILLQTAGADVQGVRLKAQTPGAAGNAFSLKVDRTDLVVTPANFSLLASLGEGTKSIVGPQFDWQAVQLGDDNIVPADAKRIVFGSDIGNIYVQYKKFENGEFSYFFEPALKTTIPESSQIGFVTGLYTVELYEGAVLRETYADVRTLYDLLDKIKTISTRLVVEGAVGKDQSPGGNHVADLQLRTDAYVSQNTGFGSRFAVGFSNVTIDTGAGTQLITAECVAANSNDAFGAGVGSEVWRVRSSIAGDIGRFKSGDVVRGADFTATIPRKVPPASQTEPKGEFDLVSIDYVPRDIDESGNPITPEPGICVNGRTLGINAYNQQLTLIYTKRPPVDRCSCVEQDANLDPACLGITPTEGEGGFSVSYSAETVARLVALYDWLADTVRTNSNYYTTPNSIIDPGMEGGLGATTADGRQDPFISTPAPGSASFVSGIDPSAGTIKFALLGTPSLTSYQKKSLFDVVALFENTIADIDKLVAGTFKEAGLVAWDDAVAEFMDDVDTYMTGGVGVETELVRATEDLTAGDIVAVLQIGTSKTVRKFIVHPATVGIGFVTEDVLAAAVVAADPIVLPDPITLSQDYDLLPNIVPGSVVVTDAVAGVVPDTDYTVDEVLGTISFSATVTAQPYTVNFDLPDNNATVHYYGEFEVPEMVQSTNTGCPTDILFETVLGTYYRIAPCNPGHLAINNTESGAYVLNTPVFYATTSGPAPYHFYLPPTNSGVIGMQLLTDRYDARVKFILISAGISPLGKSEADSEFGGDGCWQDTGDGFYWKVEGSVGGIYANAFNNTAYYSSKKAPGSAAGGQTEYTSLKEFGFYLNIPCPANLKVGDRINLQIGASGGGSAPISYQRGDKLQLGIVAAQNVKFGGGQDGDNVQTWYVRDSAVGPRASYLLDTDVPVPYVSAGITFQINQGTIPFRLGDQFQFAIEGGHFRWRKSINGVPGAWSGSIVIVTAPTVLDSGLSLSFALGSSPAFFAGDIYKFLALQPHALSNVIRPDFDSWQWGAVDPAINTIDLGAILDIEAIGVAYHSIPEGATVEINGGDAAANEWVEVLTWQKDVMALLLAVPRTARYLDLVITGGANAGIGYLFIGETTYFDHSAQVSLNREYKIKRSSGNVNPYAQFQGKAIGGSIQWTEGHLSEDDYAPMVEMLDWLKMNDDEPLLFFPQETRQTEIVLASCESDSIAFNDVYNFQPNEGRDRRLSCTIPLRGVAFT